MTLHHFKLLTDENVQQEVVAFLTSLKFDVVTVYDLNLNGKPDVEILNAAEKDNRVILTHDADFGKIVFMQKVKFTGIIFLRPGHINGSHTINTIQEIIKADIVFISPFILIAENFNLQVKLRLRNNLMA